jgi:hypothetical protein
LAKSSDPLRVMAGLVPAIHVLRYYSMKSGYAANPD